MAKQAATIDRLSGGRLVLGLSPGGREDDYEVSGVPFSGRGRRFDEQLDELGRLWRGEGGVGPTPSREGGPPVLIGGNSDAAFRRAARYADGWTMGGGTPDMFTAALEKLRAAWKAEGRDGEPRTMVLFYFALGEGVADDAATTCATTTPGWATTRRPSPTARRPTRTPSAVTCPRSSRSASTR